MTDASPPLPLYTPKSILLTGGAGFIGSHVAVLLVQKYPQYKARAALCTRPCPVRSGTRRRDRCLGSLVVRSRLPHASCLSLSARRWLCWTSWTTARA
jgi:hypothetical protein